MALTSKFLRPSQTNASDPSAGTRYVAALKAELAGYEAAGNVERAKQVRAELAKMGEVETTTAEPRAERAVKPKATRRKAE